MKNKGFTLIELLAVIIILAIIALIATPIILGIIDDSKEKSNEISIDNYAKAVENAIAKYQLQNPTSITGNFTTTDGKTLTGDKNLTVEYDGAPVVCSEIDIYEDGSFYLAGCKIDNGTKEYSYGTNQAVAIYIYSDKEISIGNTINTELYEKNPANISQSVYLKHEVVNNKVKASYSCITYTENGITKEACLRGGNPSYYASNQAILRSVEPYFNTLSKGYCNFSNSDSSCGSHSLALGAYSDGYVDAVGSGLDCLVGSDGYSNCSEY